ncbi:MAG: DNA repair protein RecN [Bacteroidaceae bacterium]|nr:DNA repair protein RecN [Bacteroidaceae bacterium]
MLKEIHINNYVLIDRLDIDFQEGFSVMTGETGAGKSIILGAMNLLLGGRADSKTIMQGADKCTIEGTFSVAGYGLEQFFTDNGLDYYPDDTTLRRELLQSGKSRAFINDTPVSLNQMRDLGCRLIDIHSQHQNLALGTQSFQLDVVDTIAANADIKAAYEQGFDNWSKLKADLARLKAEFESDNTDREYLEFQLKGLDDARLKEGELQELEQESDLLEHAEEIKQELFRASELISGDEDGTLTRLRSALQSLRSAQKNWPQAQELSERLDSCLIELKDIAETVDDAQEGINFDPARLEQVNERLDLIYTLLKKHKKENISELLELAESIRTRLDRSGSYELDIEKLTRQVEAARGEMEKRAAELTKSRQKASDVIIKDIKALLVPLGIPNIQFRIDIRPAAEYDCTGHDDLRFMFSANKAVPMQELSQVASGGEIARVMLSVKSLIASVRTLPTIIFDEIDTGVSGAVAEKMALLMEQMAGGGRQVLAITHLPQIAALGHTHYKVYKTEEKDATRTRIALLDYNERIREIASMMSGATLTQAALDNAKTLIDNNGR